MTRPPRDALRGARLPIATVVLVALNVLVYLVGLFPAERQVEGSTRQVPRHDVWVAEYGAIPCELTGRCANQDAVVLVDGGFLDPQPRSVSARVDQQPPVMTLFTSMFLHGGMLHLVFNLLLLWLFGRRVEQAMHPLGLVPFYLLSGMVAGIAQALAAASATAPVVGASGAIAAMIGAYVWLSLRRQVEAFTILWIPAWVVAAGWGALQLVATWQSILSPAGLTGGVAYMAHLAGFAFGLAAAAFFADRTVRRA